MFVVFCHGLNEGKTHIVVYCTATKSVVKLVYVEGSDVGIRVMDEILAEYSPCKFYTEILDLEETNRLINLGNENLQLRLERDAYRSLLESTNREITEIRRRHKEDLKCYEETEKELLEKIKRLEEKNRKSAGEIEITIKVNTAELEQAIKKAEHDVERVKEMYKEIDDSQPQITVKYRPLNFTSSSSEIKAPIAATKVKDIGTDYLVIFFIESAAKTFYEKCKKGIRLKEDKVIYSKGARWFKPPYKVIVSPRLYWQVVDQLEDFGLVPRIKTLKTN